MRLSITLCKHENTLLAFASYVRAFIILSLISLCTSLGSTQALRPNILFVLTDDQRWDALGQAGNNVIHTPEMDRLASEGIYFKNAFVTTPICAASRASIMTGLYERNHRYTFGQPPLDKKYFKNSYFSQLKKAGYATGFIGKFGVKIKSKIIHKSIDDHQPNGQGTYFRLVEGGTKHRHLTEVIGDKAIEYIQAQRSDQPFCLSISFHAPHASDESPQQYIWPSTVNHLYEDIVIPDPLLADQNYFAALPDSVQAGFNYARWKWRYDTPEKYQKMVKGYYRMISGVDHELGRIRKQLRSQGLDQNTIIIFTSDNGYFLGERNIAGKWLMYEPSIRVPLIIYDPRYEGGKDFEDLVLNIDIAPTMLDMAGLTFNTNMYDGRSLLPLVNGSLRDMNREAFICEHLWQFPPIPASEGIRTQRYKYFRYQYDTSLEEVYDLQEDPNETVNMANDPDNSGIVDRLRHKYYELLRTIVTH